MDDLKPHMMPKVRSDRLMSEARGKPCTIRIASLYPGLRCNHADTSVRCHLDGIGGVSGKGTSTKVTDLAGACGCNVCHDIISGVRKRELEWLMEKCPVTVMQSLLNAYVMTHTMMIEEGVIVIPDGDLIYSGQWR